MRAQIDLLLFDLGGVLVELGDPSEKTAWFDPALTARENWNRWLTSPNSQAFERGEISPEQFANQFLRENRIEIDTRDFLQQYKDWVLGFYPGALSLMQQLSNHYTIGVFSNITEVHWPEIKLELEQSQAISHYFASYLMGQAKPERHAFLYVAEQMKVAPDSILFIDDNEINVEGAKSAGMYAEVARGMDQLKTALAQYSVVPQ